MCSSNHDIAFVNMCRHFDAIDMRKYNGIDMLIKQKPAFRRAFLFIHR
jgi:hypothetical protein